MRLLIATLIYTLVGFWLLPLILRGVASSQLRKALNREVAIAKVRFNPYTFAVEIHGLDIQDTDGQPFAGWSRLRVDFQFTSIFYGPWRIREITLEDPRARIQVNPDYTFNFTDLIEKFASETPPPEPKEPAPLPRVWIDNLRVAAATLDYHDLTPSTPFRRRLGPIDLNVPSFSTLPGHTNSLSLKGTTDAGEQLAWESQLWIDPLRLTGKLTLSNLQLNQYTALYQDFLQVQLREGTVHISTAHDLQFNPTNQVARLTDNRFTLSGLRVGLPASTTNLLELDQLLVQAPALDVWLRQAHVEQVLIDGVRVSLRRLADEKIEIVEIAQPPPAAPNPPGSALFLLASVTNLFAMFGDSTNAASATVDDFTLTNTALALVDEAAKRPVQAHISDLALRVRNVSNLPDATPSAALSLRWQTNGTLALNAAGALTPPAANLELDLRDLDLSMLDAYLPDAINVSLVESRFSLEGRAWIEAPPDQEPSGQFQGRLALDRLHTEHSLTDHNLLSWDGFRLDGITANLHPLEVDIERIELAAPELWAILHTNGTLNLLTAADIHEPVLTPPGSPAPEAALADSSAAAAQDTATLAEPEASAPDPDQPASAPLVPVRIASFVLTNATLNLLDRMATPQVPLTITNLHGELSQLSSTNLQHADFDFQGRVRSGGTFAIRGQLRPFDASEPTEAHVTFSDLELTPGSPYTARFLGYRLDAGKLTADLTYQVANGQLQATNHIILDRFTLGARVDSPDAIKAPIKLGIAVLQDRQGRIDLNIPVSGSLDDPQFSLGGVIQGAFANVFTKVLTSPFSMLGSMFGAKEDDNLQELEFEPGTTNLVGRSVTRLEKVEDILYERPGLQLLIHGAADAETDDTPALRQSILFERLREDWQARHLPDTDENAESPGPDFAETDYLTAVQQAYLETTNTLPSDQTQPAEEEPAPDTGASEASDASAETPVPTTATESRRLPQSSMRGGQIMVRNRLRALQQPAPAAATPEPAETPNDAPESADAPEPTLPSFEEMEKQLLENLEFTPEDWGHLATARAEMIRQGLLEPARIDPERIVIAEPLDPLPPESKARLELQ